jgi:hypothetical protein
MEARFERVPQKDHTGDDIDSYAQADSPVRQK